MRIPTNIFYKEDVLENCLCLGVDTAQNNTGYCLVRTSKEYIDIIGFYSIKISGSKKDNLHDTIDTYVAKALDLRKKIDKETEVGLKKKVIIEDCWYGQNVWTLKILSKYHVINYLTFRKWADEIPLPIQPRSARSKLGFKKKGNHPIKKQVLDFVSDTYGLDIEDDNHCDALILALNGVINV